MFHLKFLLEAYQMSLNKSTLIFQMGEKDVNSYQILLFKVKHQLEQLYKNKIGDGGGYNSERGL